MSNLFTPHVHSTFCSFRILSRRSDVCPFTFVEELVNIANFSLVSSLLDEESAPGVEATAPGHDRTNGESPPLKIVDVELSKTLPVMETLTMDDSSGTDLLLSLLKNVSKILKPEGEQVSESTPPNGLYVKKSLPGDSEWIIRTEEFGQQALAQIKNIYPALPPSSRHSSSAPPTAFSHESQRLYETDRANDVVNHSSEDLKVLSTKDEDGVTCISLSSNVLDLRFLAALKEITTKNVVPS